MGDPVIRELGISGKTSECLQTPVDPKFDKCQVVILEGPVDKSNTFTLERKGRDYNVASADQARVNKLFPTFKPPVQDLKDYLLARGEFFKAFGDSYEPSDFGKTIKLSAGGSSPMQIVDNYTNLLSAFIGTGETDPDNAVKKYLLSNAVMAGVFAYADPQLGPKIAEVLGQIDKNTSLSSPARGRVALLISVQEAWNKLWPHHEPAAAKVSVDLAKKMKFSATQVVHFLLVNHVLTDQGMKGLFKDLYETGKNFYDEMSRLDVDGSQFGDYYEFLRKGIKLIKTPKLSKAQQDEFNKRLALLDKALGEAAANKIAFLGNQSTQKSAKESLRIKYGDTPTRLKVLEVILKNLEVKDVSGRPNFEVKIDPISTELRTLINSQIDTKVKAEHIEALNYLLKQLFERGGKMKMFLQNDFEEIDNFYDTVKRSLLSQDSKTLESLVQWALSQAGSADLNLDPSAHPHTPLRKWTLISEFGVAGIGTGAAFAFNFGATDPNVKYYGTGGSIILGASGLGAAGGNLISYAADVNPKYNWIFDVGGAILGGLAGGLIYGAATGWGPPGGGITPPPGMDPGRRFPVDPYGP